MIRTFLATTAIAAVLTGGVYAQDATAPMTPASPVEQAAPVQQIAPASGHLASNLIGETVYNGTGDDAENIGSVTDLVIAEDGSVDSIIIGVGGFLGIGQKNIAVEYADAKWAEGNGDRWLVISGSKEQLESLPQFDTAPYNVAPAVVADGGMADGTAAPVTERPLVAEGAKAPAAGETTAAAPAAPMTNDAAPMTNDTAAAPAAPATDDTAAAPAAPATDQTAQAPVAPTDGTAAAPATDATQTAAIDRSTLSPLNGTDIRSEDLVGTTVYGADDANVGEIGDIVLTADGQVDAIIIDVGGFLGIGEKEVAVGMDNLQFMTDGSGNTYLYTTLTKDQLEAQAAYDQGSYTANRDQQRLSIQ